MVKKAFASQVFHGVLFCFVSFTLKIHYIFVVVLRAWNIF
jgi:hypothetical protein